MGDLVSERDEARALLRDALDRQVRPCDHAGIGLPGCRDCDPRVRDYRRTLPKAALTVLQAGGAMPAPALGMRYRVETADRKGDGIVVWTWDGATWLETVGPSALREITDGLGRPLWRCA